MSAPIGTDRAPSPAGHYAQAVRAGDFVYVSGQVPRTPDGGYTPADVAAETRLTLGNLAAIAEAAGGGLGDVVKVTAYLTRQEYFGEFNTAYAEYFGEHRPARTTVVAGLREVKVEVDAVLHLPVLPVLPADGSRPPGGHRCKLPDEHEP
ncbi:RidA family protein [Streptosporangium saharense]|uniref:2-iminobutanoate/2-iminopropanoate deaminase n=1 Tax=Streptosporangium saharense TaxID=1706840 RepID=A0A7W7QT25_9ACTN|nr:Rid family detoxifying hydrolase [Streptosporangium saharense]MBB4919203.1 2-iminobutanoate/2-iminopropanoate deaminase [Streptosporangium saharense]